MENRFKVESESSGRTYIIRDTFTGKRTDYTIGEWLDACNLCHSMNALQPAQQEKELEFFV